MASIELNILQERELGRLLDYERATCTVDGEHPHEAAMFRLLIPIAHSLRISRYLTISFLS